MGGSRSGLAFTLLEVLLALGVMTLLVGVVALGIAGGAEREYLDEGAARFETVLRMARAEAANRARALRLTVDERGACAVVWEPRPFEEPGVYVPYTASGWAKSLPNEMVRVRSSRLTGTELYRPPASAIALTNDPADQDAPPQAITFYPDGSCDSAVLELRSTDDRDERTAVIEVDGINAIFATRILTPTELEEMQP